MRKKLLSMALLIAMCLSLCPAALAAEEGSCWDVVDLEAAENASYAVTANGDLYGWGRLPLENKEESTPHKLQSGVKAVAAATNTSLYDYGSPANGTYYFIKQNGDLYGVGSNDHDQFGQGTSDGEAHDQPVFIMSNVREVVADGAAIAAITTNDDLYMWGFLFNGRQTTLGTKEPKLMMSDVREVDLSDQVAVVLKNDGSVYSMGWEIINEWPDETTGDTMVKLSTEWHHRMDGCVAIATAGTTATYAVKSDGSLWGWGNDGRMLGREHERRQMYIQRLNGLLDVTRAYPDPVLVADGGVVDVCGSFQSSYFRKSDGSLWALGTNHYGEMGQGDLFFDPQANGESFAAHPYKVSDNVDKFDVGHYFCLYTTTDGRMWGFGLNNFHQLGHDRKGLSYHNSVGSGTVAYPIISGLSVLPGPGSKPQKPAEPTGIFSDVPVSAYCYESTEWAVDKGITAGTGEGMFSPDHTCTVAQILTFLYRAAGEPETSGVCPFAGVDASSPYYNALCWAGDQGMMSVASSSADAECTRAMAVSFMWQAAGSPVSEAATSFTDVVSSAHYAEAVDWAVEQGVTQGTGENTFSPDQTCTRGQIVTFLYRATGE